MTQTPKALLVKTTVSWMISWRVSLKVCCEGMDWKKYAQQKKSDKLGIKDMLFTLYERSRKKGKKWVNWLDRFLP